MGNEFNRLNKEYQYLPYELSLGNDKRDNLLFSSPKALFGIGQLS